jgi:hypothetical protein
MVSPNVSPRKGVAIYQFDATQGPACAIACPAGTAYRNYLVHGGAGQGDRQINTLSKVESLLGSSYWSMKNGYALPLKKSSMAELGKRLQEEEGLAAECHSNVSVGIHWDTMVEDTIQHAKDPSTQKWVNRMVPARHRVAQVYASACPVAYDRMASKQEWAPFARLVLAAAYDATLLAGEALSKRRGGERVKVYLTKLGDGAFGNETSWVAEAVQKALEDHRDAPLDVYLVHYGPNERTVKASELLTVSSNLWEWTKVDLQKATG